MGGDSCPAWSGGFGDGENDPGHVIMEVCYLYYCNKLFYISPLYHLTVQGCQNNHKVELSRAAAKKVKDSVQVGDVCSGLPSVRL